MPDAISKFFRKTQPTKQWKFKHEMLRRIKKRFDELNIEIPRRSARFITAMTTTPQTWID